MLVEDLWYPALMAGHTIDEIGGRFDGDQLGAGPDAQTVLLAMYGRSTTWTP